MGGKNWRACTRPDSADQSLNAIFISAGHARIQLRRLIIRFKEHTSCPFVAGLFLGFGRHIKWLSSPPLSKKRDIIIAYESLTVISSSLSFFLRCQFVATTPFTPIMGSYTPDAGVMSAMCITFSFATILLVCRLVSRKITHIALWLDDYFAITSWVRLLASINPYPSSSSSPHRPHR
jgi:hypothetical protein